MHQHDGDIGAAPPEARKPVRLDEARRAQSGRRDHRRVKRSMDQLAERDRHGVPAPQPAASSGFSDRFSMRRGRRPRGRSKRLPRCRRRTQMPSAPRHDRAAFRIRERAAGAVGRRGRGGYFVPPTSRRRGVRSRRALLATRCPLPTTPNAHARLPGGQRGQVWMPRSDFSTNRMSVCRSSSLCRSRAQRFETCVMSTRTDNTGRRAELRAPVGVEAMAFQADALMPASSTDSPPPSRRGTSLGTRLPPR